MAARRQGKDLHQYSEPATGSFDLFERAARRLKCPLPQRLRAKLEQWLTPPEGDKVALVQITHTCARRCQVDSRYDAGLWTP